MTDISMLISTFNRGHLLTHSLDRLLGLTLPRELIVVDDGGNDETQQVVSEFMEKAECDVQYIYTHNPRKSICSHARNVGLKAASYDWLVTSEPELVFRSDVVAQFDQLKSEHPKKVISTGRVWFAKQGFVPGSNCQIPPNAQGAVRWHAPHAAIWNREWLLEVGGWDEGFPGAWGWDDTDLLTRLRLAGYGQHMAPEVEAVHLYHGHGTDNSAVNERHFRAKSFMRDETDLSDLVANKGQEWGKPIQGP